MSYKPGDSLTVEFNTCSSTGALANADSLPTATLSQGGTDDGTVTVTVTNKTTGTYKAVCTIPSGYAAGNSVSLRVNATIGGVAAGVTIGPLVLDSKRLADKPAVALAATDVTGKLAATVAAGDAADLTAGRLGKLDSLTFTTAGRVDSTAVAVSDKTGYGLATTPPTAAATATAVRTELAAELGRVDVAVSSRHSAAQQTADLSSILTNLSNVPGLVWAVTTRTLTGFGTLAADVWAVATRTITGGAYNGTPPTAAQVSAQVAADLATAHGSGAWTTADLTALASALTALAAEVAKVPRDGKSATYTQTASDAAAKSATVTIGAVG